MARARARRTVTAATASAGLIFAAFLSSVAYGLVSSTSAAPAPLTAAATLKPEVGVMFDASAKQARRRWRGSWSAMASRHVCADERVGGLS